MRDFTPRVAFFTDSFHEANGVARTSREFAAYARSAYFPFLAVHPGPTTTHLRRGHYEEFQVAPGSQILRLEHDLTFDLLFLRHLRAVQRAVEAFEPDVIHVTGPGHCGILGALIAYRLGIPLAASWHTNVHEYGARRLSKMLAGLPGSHGIAARAEKGALDLAVRFYRMARLLFAPNPELIEMLSARTAKTVYPMHRGIDCELFSPAKRTPGERPFTIGYVGRLSTEKNVRVFAEVERALRIAGLHDYRLRIIGDGSERAWLREHLQCADLPGLMHGEELAAAYANMDVFMFPSETDTYGNVVQEAMASGAPCVVSAHGGPRFLVESGSTGFIAHDPAGYAEGILRLALNPGLHMRMSTTARTWALQRSWRAVFAGVYAAYRAAFRTGHLAKPSRASRPAVLRPV